MRDLLLSYLTTAFIYWSPPIYAQDTLPAIPPGDDVIEEMKKGDLAPFDGQLFDTDTAIRWGLWLKQYKSIVGLEKERAEQLCRVRLDYDRTILNIEIEKFSTIEHDLKARLSRAEAARLKAEYELTNPVWYKTGTFYFALGVASAGALIWVGTAVIH